jgi:hypothetical protein
VNLGSIILTFRQQRTSHVNELVLLLLFAILLAAGRGHSQATAAGDIVRVRDGGKRLTRPLKADSVSRLRMRDNERLWIGQHDPIPLVS